MTTAFHDLAGPVTDPEKICTRLLLAVFASDYSQSNMFQGTVSSFQYLVAEAGGNFVMLKTGMYNMFSDLLLRHFPAANVQVDIEPIPNEPSKVSIQLRAMLTTGEGQQIDFASAILADNDQALQIIVRDRVIWTK